MDYKLADALVRQQALIGLDKIGQKVEIIGAGATGSVVSLTLAKMGFINQEVWDADEVDVVNMNCQMFGYKHIGMPKVEALADLFKMYSNAELYRHNEWFTGNEFLSGVVVSALDTMKGRRLIYDCAVKCGVRWLLDPRTSIEYAEMHVVDMHDMASRTNYEKTLFSDDDVPTAPCTMRATMYTSNLIAGLVCKAIKDIAVNGTTFKVVMYDIASNECMFFGRE